MNIVGTIKVDMAPVSQIMRRLGVTPDGDVQMFVTEMVNHRITRYMPFSAGVMATKTKFIGGVGHQHMAEGGKKITGPTEITVIGPYAHYQYAGVVWVDPVTRAAGFLTKNGWRSRRGVPKVRTDRKLQYDRNKNELAGPFWDRRLVAAEGAAMQEDLQRYVDRRA